MFVVLRETECCVVIFVFASTLEVPEPNQPQLSRTEPRVLSRTKKANRVPSFFELSLETSRAEMIGLGFEPSPSPEPTPSLKSSPESKP